MPSNYQRPIQKIAILSDSHGKTENVKVVLEKIEELSCDALIHAGDICDELTLQMMQKTRLPLFLVFGNNDRKLFDVANVYSIEQEPYYFEIAGVNFKLMHLPFYMNGDCDVLIYGHTHKFEAQKYGKTLFINPGEVCAREKPYIEFVTLNLNETYAIERFSKNIDKNDWTVIKMEFER